MKRLSLKLAKRTATVAMVGALTAAVAGCDDPTSKSAGEYLELAQRHLDAGKPRTSVIEIKNALQEDPENAEARLLLGEVYLELRNPLAAEKEFLRAQQFGIPPERVLVPLGQVWLMQGKPDKVLSSIKVDPAISASDKARILVLRGNANHAMGNIDDAEASYQDALSEQPNMPDAILGLGNLALDRNDLETARTHRDQLRDISADDYRTTLMNADVAMAEGEFAAAAAGYQKVVDARPHDLGTELKLSWAQIHVGEPEEAAKHLTKLSKLMGGNARIQFMRALAAYESGDHQAAKQFAEQALTIEPNHPESLFIAGASAYSLNQLQSANRHLGKLIFRLPSHQLARRLLAATQLKLGMAERSAETLGPIEPLNESDAELFSAVAQAAMRSGDFETGESILEQVAAIQAGRAEARAELGYSKLAVGDVEEGIAELEEALRLDPKLEGAGLVIVMSQLRLGEYDKALERAREIQLELPDSPHAYTLEGLALAGTGNLEGAHGAFTKAWTVAPGDVNAGLNLAAYAILQGEVDEARTFYDAVLESNPDNLGALIALASFEIRQRNTDQALAVLQRAVDGHPDDVRARVLLAAVHLDKGETAQAMAVTDGLLDQYPNNPGLLQVVGLANLDRGALDDAAQAFKVLVEVKPEQPSARYYLGLTYEGLGHVSLARRHVDRLMELDPEHADGKFLQARLMAAAGELEPAQARLEELNVDYPDSPDLLELEGSIALARREPEKAVELYQQALEGKQTTFLTLRMALAQTAAGRRDQAMATLEQWIGQVPDDLLVRRTLGSTYLVDGRLADAQAQFAAIVERSPNSAFVLNDLAWVLSQQGDLDGALQHAEKARSLVPDDPDILDTVGVIYLKKGQTENALPLLQKAADLAEDDPDIQFHLAQALAGNGKVKDATKLLRVLLAQNPSFSERGDAEALLSELDG